MATIKCSECDGTGRICYAGWEDSITRSARCGCCNGSGQLPCCENMTVGGECQQHDQREFNGVHCTGHVDYAPRTKERLQPGHITPAEVAAGLTRQSIDDIELTMRALRACGYRVHLKERNGTQWVTACKGLQVRYEHWHPLTNINQAMQLLAECGRIEVLHAMFYAVDGDLTAGPTDSHALIAAQCRAIVTACASLEVVR